MISTNLSETKKSQKTILNHEKVRIICDDLLSSQAIKEKSVDLIITSPPYNLDMPYGTYEDFMPYEEYLKWSTKWMEKCYQLSKDGGRFCLNVPLDKNKGGHHSVAADLTACAKQAGWEYFSTIIWNEGNISRRTAWGSFMSASAPYIIAPVEVIIVLYKEHWKKSKRGKSDISKQEFMDWTNGLWTFSGESKKRVGHPAPFPIELPARCIKLFSYTDDVVLDPFVGSGTTLIAAVKNGRYAIGIDIDKNYCQLSSQRLMSEAKLNQTNFLFD